MSKQYIEAQLKKSDNSSLTFIASDETLDRSGEVVPIDSWVLDNYERNPVLLVNHDYQVQNIVGMARNIRKEAKKLLFDPVFHGITQLSREVKEMVEKGFLNTVSVGFMPHGPQKDGERPTNELFEISFVPVPANPSAERLNAVMAKSIKDDTEMKSIEEWVKEQSIEKKKEEKSPACRMTDESKEECVARKIPEIMKEDPSMEQDQAVAIAESVCGKKCGDDSEDDDTTEEGKSIEKEGRVLSGKNRKLINEAVDTLKTATAALGDLLNASEPTITNDGQAGDINEKGREPKVVYVQTEKENDVPSAVIRALQSVNRITNDSLRKFKK